MPRLSTVENIMKVSQMVVQALWDNKSSLLQLPHITEDQLRHFVTRKVYCHHDPLSSGIMSKLYLFLRIYHSFVLHFFEIF